MIDVKISIPREPIEAGETRRAQVVDALCAHLLGAGVRFRRGRIYRVRIERVGKLPRPDATGDDS